MTNLKHPIKTKYTRHLMLHGILSMLYVLEYLEAKECFEECQEIIDTILSYNDSFLETKFPTRICDEVKQMVINEWDNGIIKCSRSWADDEIENVYRYYAELTIKELAL